MDLILSWRKPNGENCTINPVKLGVYELFIGRTPIDPHGPRIYFFDETERFKVFSGHQNIYVSRKHLLVVISDRTVILRDHGPRGTGSKNGTLVAIGCGETVKLHGDSIELSRNDISRGVMIHIPDPSIFTVNMFEDHAVMSSPDRGGEDAFVRRISLGSVVVEENEESRMFVPNTFLERPATIYFQLYVKIDRLLQHIKHEDLPNATATLSVIKESYNELQRVEGENVFIKEHIEAIEKMLEEIVKIERLQRYGEKDRILRLLLDCLYELKGYLMQKIE
ncbi:MAG: FHA domain-containing protein [Crenarchaeota archaeon]|nr:FHA domain-containing protein [Thermoproteota archaeon]